MWRMKYTIARNLFRLPRLIETMHRMTDRRDQYSEQDAYDYVRYIARLMQTTGHIKTECFGTENLPAEGGYILYPNHQGKYDAYGILSVHDRPLTVVMDREQSYFLLVNEIIDVLRGKRMDIHDPRQGLRIINEIAGEVAQGRRYIIFPEGAYSDEKHHKLWDFRPGCFKAATKSHVPIIPVVLVDSYRVYNSWQLSPVTTQVHFLAPVCYEEYQSMNTMQISALVKERMRLKLTQLGLE